MSDNRRELLDDLLNYKYSWPLLAEKIRGVPFSAPHSLVNAKPDHVTATLKRFLLSELSALDVEEWANIIEMREDIEFDEKTKEAIWELANPKLAEPLTPEVAKRIIKDLRT